MPITRTHIAGTACAPLTSNEVALSFVGYVVRTCLLAHEFVTPHRHVFTAGQQSRMQFVDVLVVFKCVSFVHRCVTFTGMAIGSDLLDRGGF